ncbi:MAG: lipopolysaccharide kinase InaA family protein [Desulfobacteraceae bacterium]
MNDLFKKKSFNIFLLCKNDRYTPEMENFLKNPDTAFDIPDDLLLKNGNSATLVKTAINNKELVIKRYNMKTIAHALRRAFKKTRAWQSWHYAHLLQKIGIHTPYPVAMKEKRFGPFRNKAYFIFEFVQGSTAFDYFHDQNIDFKNKLIVAEKIIDMLNKLKDSKLSHGDMKATNIIINDDMPYLIDLDSMNHHKTQYLFKKARKKDINRFIKNWDDLPEIEKLFKQID